jgi:acetyl-CoA C-acetyltransferase
MTMPPRSLDPRTPVLVGVGQLDVPADLADPADEPVDLMARALRAAADDTGASGVLDAIDSVRVVSMLSWRYPDPGAVLAGKVGAHPRHTAVSPMGGNSPQMLVNRTALDILAGSADVVVIAGAEAWRTRQAFRRRGENPPWSEADPAASPAEVIGSEMEMSHPAEQARGVAMPIHAYPILDVAIRAAAGRSPADHLERISDLWSSFSQVAVDNPHAAVREGFTATSLRTPTPDNRWVGYPYTKWMVSNDRVDQAAALILCSVERAEALGIGRDRWVFPWAGTDTAEPTMSERHDLHRSPAIRIGGGRALELAGIGVDDLAHIDLYSCFPSAVQIGASELGLGLDRQLTVTGGLTFAGGPWNNYVTHSIATMAGVLREAPGSIGFCTANGGLISKHSFGVYSTEPPAEAFRHDVPQSQVDSAPHRAVAADHEGPVTIEAYTVMHGRDGEPEVALVACLLDDGRRTWARSSDPALMTDLVTGEASGLAAEVGSAGELHLL